MRCPTCNFDNPSDFAYCGRCGAPLPRLCHNCGLESPGSNQFCGYCGARLTRPSADSSQSALEGERRFAVVLFADIAGFTRLSEQLDAEEATTLVNQCLEQLTDIVVQHGGRVDKYVGDAIMAVFGAPTSHEDDPERALRTALAMREAVSDLKFDMDIPQPLLHIGVAYGQVVAAGVGGKGRKEYTVIGAAVNLASRLEDASTPGQILVGKELAQLTEHVFLFEPVMLPYVHGLEGPVMVYALTSERQDTVSRRAQELQSPLVSRDAEKDLLQHSLLRLMDGQGGVVSLIGEAGVGKSRLLREVQAQARSQGLQFNWLEGDALEIGEPARYGHFRTLLRNAIGVNEQLGTCETAECLGFHLEKLLPGRVGEIYPYLGRVLGVLLDQEAAEKLERLDGESLKWQTFRGVQEWVQAMAKQAPLALIFDNLHWMDPTSTELLEQVLLLTKRLPVLILGVYRPEPECPAWQLREAAVRRYEQTYTELWLHPLPQEATEQMVKHLLTENVPQPVLDLTWQKTEGNPLFIEEVVRSMMDQHVLVQRKDGVWELTSGWARANIPNTVHGILQSRVDRLNANARRVLQIAACIGRKFPYELLAAVSDIAGLPLRHLDGCLETLEQAALIQRESESPKGEYTFKYMLIRDIAHGNLLRGARSQIHMAIAQWYEANALQSPEPPYALLAYHYEQTDNIAKQKHYLALAGHQAARVYANQEACTFFTKALALSHDPEERFELLLACERIWELLGDRVQQRADLEELLQLANQVDSDQRRAIVYNHLAELYASQGDYPAALAVADTARDAARRAGDVHAEAESFQTTASTAWRQGHFEPALDAAQQAIELAGQANDAALQATALTSLGIIHRSMGNLASARECYQQALDLRRAIDEQRGEAVSLNQLGNLFYDEGDYASAREHCQQALDLFRQVGDRRGEAWSLSGLGTLYLRCGAYEDARLCYDEALAHRRTVNDQRGEAVALADLGNALFALGRLAEARANLEQAVLLMQKLGARRDEVYALTYLAFALEKSGELDAARSVHQSALAIRQEQKQPLCAVENLAGLARIALAKGELDKAKSQVEYVMTVLSEQGLTNIESPFLVYQTCIHVLQMNGEQERAQETLRQAHRQLVARADLIGAPDLRQSFLEHVPENQSILALWQSSVPA
jgi:adenylate cyclase